MKKIKVIHIHTDIKFINGINRFYGEEFENISFIIGSKDQYKGPYEKDVRYYDNTLKDYNQIINQCEKSDIVVLYNLCFIKSFIAKVRDLFSKYICLYDIISFSKLSPNAIYKTVNINIISNEVIRA